MSFVLDSSITLAWIFAEETTGDVIEVFELLRQQGAWAPGLWRLEVANALQMGIRRRRIDEAFRDASLADLTRLPIQVDPETDLQAWGTTLELAERHRLTLYDAAYLELALRRNLPLATLDGELRAATKAERVRLLGA
jgi:predicted nucleic acid-binding protein